MSITISDGITTLELPDDLHWADEHAWSPVAQTVEHALDGALLVFTTARQAGRPITLAGAEDRAWITRAEVEQLRTWAALPGQQLTLTLHGTARTVVFRHQDGTVVDAEPVMFWVPMLDTHYYTLTLRLMEV